MSKPDSNPLSLSKLGDIDQMTYIKAGTILSEAQNHLRQYHHDLAVRRAQEAFELHVKALFRFLQSDYPESHDLKKQIYELSKTLAPFGITTHQVAELVVANVTLSGWRLPSFYGDETLSVGDLFSREEADVAISYARRAQFICNIVRGQAYQRATASETT